MLLQAKLKDADKQIQELQQKIAAGEQNWKRANQSPGKSMSIDCEFHLSVIFLCVEGLSVA